MKTRLLQVLLLFLFTFATSNMMLAQTGDCPYPVIFIHGLDSDGTAFDPTMNNGGFSGIWGARSDYFFAVPNSWEDQEDDIRGNDGVFQDNGRDDDVQWIFDNENNVLAAGCIYAINFKNDVNNHVIDRWADGAPDDGSIWTGASANNEAAILKQGYALKQAIKAVLAANPTKDKVVLVGHSMGGLCTREYLQRTQGGAPRWWVDPSSPDGHKVKRVLTIGTPHRGSNTFDFLSLKGEQEGDPTERSGERTNSRIPNIWSEAVRDLRYEVDCKGWFCSMPGPYLFGGKEDDIENDYFSEDVNCDGNEDDTIVGINDESNGFNGTSDNPNMPLPMNIRYTYYVSNVTGGALSTCKYKNYGCAGDAVVDDQRQWIYSGGQGRTEDYVDGLSIPVPNDGVPHRLTDRVTSQNRTDHLQQTGDINYHISGMDEGDYPEHAWKINFDGGKFAGIVQMPPDLRPTDGNRAANQDKDWYYFDVPNNMMGMKITVRPNVNRSGRIDVYKNPAAYEQGNSATNLTFGTGTTSDQVIKVIGCLGAGERYYVRVQHDGISRTDWSTPFTIEASSLPVEIPTAVGVYTATGETTDDAGWTHYWKDASASPVTTNDLLLLSIKKDGTAVISPSEVKHGVTGVGGYLDMSSTDYAVSRGTGYYVMNRYWDVTPSTQPGGAGVDVKFYYKNYDYNDVANQVNSVGGAIVSPADLEFYKFDTNAGIDPNPANGHIGGNATNFLIPAHINATCVTEEYAEMHVTGFSGGGGGGGGGGLPVDLIAFDGERNGRQIDLMWTTASESNTSHFEVEKGAGSLRFEQIGKKEAAGESSTEIAYSFVDTEPVAGSNYYRLRMVDLDGSFEYSNVIEVAFNIKKAIEILALRPVPVKNTLNVDFTSNRNATTNVIVVDALGRQVFHQEIQAQAGANNLQIDMNDFSNGVYFLQIVRPQDNVHQVQKFSKQ